MRPWSFVRLLSLCALCLCGCGPDAILIVVSVQGDSGGGGLAVDVALDGRAAAREEFDAGVRRFGLSLPPDSRGRLRIDVRTTPGGRIDAAGSFDGPLTGEAEQDVSIALIARPVKTFKVSVEMALEDGAAGAPTIVSSPAGMSCAPNGGACSGDFVEGTKVQLTPQLAGDGTSYFAGWIGCERAGLTPATAPCQASAAATLRAVFRPKVCSTDGFDADALPWCWESPLPHGIGLRAVWASAADDAWAVGERGVIQHFDGKLWRVTEVAGTLVRSYDLLAVAGRGPRDVWAVGSKGKALHYDGAAWTEQSPSLVDNRRLAAVWVSDAGTAWAATDNREIWRYTRGNWSKVQSLNATAAPTAITGTSDSDVWVVGQSGLAWHFDGTQWAERRPPGSPSLRAAWAAAPGELWAGGDGALRHYQGGAWIEAPALPAAGYTILGLGTDGGGGLWLVGSTSPPPELGAAVTETRRDGLIIHVSGSAPTVQRDGASVPALRGVTALPGGQAFAVGDYGVVVQSAGRAWAQILPDGPTDDFASVWGSGADNVWIAARGRGAALRRFKGGSWSPVASGTAGGLSYLSGNLDPVSSRIDMWAVGALGTLVRWSADRWSEVQAPAIFAPNLNGAYVGGSDDAWIVGDGGVFVRWDGAPTVLRVTDAGRSPDLLGVWSGAPGTALAVGTGGCWRLRPGAAPFTKEISTQLPDALHYDAVWGASERDIWVSTREGSIHKFTIDDAGSADWQSVYTLENPDGNGATHPPLAGISGSSAADVWFVGGNGSSVRWDGQNFKARRTPSRAALSGVWTPCAGSALAVGAAGTILRYASCPR